MTGEVRVCGLGLRMPQETTLEALQALRECDSLFVSVADARSRRWLERWCGRARRPKDAAQVVAAASGGRTVGLAVWGHPEYTSVLAREVGAAALAAGASLRVYAGVSPVSSVFARSVTFLGGDFGHRGARSCDLESALASPESISPRLPALIFAESAKPARWADLKRALSARYPASHPVRAYPAGTDEERATTLAALDVRRLAGAVLLVPPLAGSAA